MKIGIDMRMAGIRHGGIGRYVLELINQLLKIDSENEYYLFYNDNDQVESLRIKDSSFPQAAKDKKGLKINLIKVNIRHYSLTEQLLLPGILNRYNLDLMHFPNFNAPIFYKRPFIATIHDLIHHKIGGVKKTNLVHYAAYKKVIKNAVQRCQKIISVSYASKNEIVSEFNIEGSKIEVIYEGLPLHDYSTPKQITNFRSRFYLNKPYFIFVGVLQRNKNLPGLCRGFNFFLQTYGHAFDLVIVGKKDPHYPDIIKECLQIKSSKNLVFTGELDEEDLAAAYCGAYAYVSASLFEGFGLPGLEAMHFGLPLAVSNIAVFNEIYENGAIYFDPKNEENIAKCLNLLVQDRLYYMQVKNKAKLRSKMFSWETCALQTFLVYEQVYNNSNNKST